MVYGRSPLPSLCSSQLNRTETETWVCYSRFPGCLNCGTTAERGNPEVAVLCFDNCDRFAPRAVVIREVVGKDYHPQSPQTCGHPPTQQEIGARDHPQRPSLEGGIVECDNVKCVADDGTVP